jgi:hypothetical protein
MEFCSTVLLHLKLCMRNSRELALSTVQNACAGALSNNVGATCWGFQQLSPRYGVLLLDAPLSISVQLLQLARRNLRPEYGQQRPGCEHSVPVNQPPLAKAPLGSEVGWACADETVLKGFTAQRVRTDAALGYASIRAVCRSPKLFATEMASNCYPFSDCVLPKDHFDAVSASKSTDGCSLSNSQGVHSC